MDLNSSMLLILLPMNATLVSSKPVCILYGRVQPLLDWTRAVWFKGHIPKHAFTFWIATQDRLPTRERLCQWGMQISPLCCLCGTGNETKDHLFLFCRYTQEVWQQLARRLQHPMLPFHTWNVLITWLLSRTPSLSQTLKRLVTHVFIYFIWQERNKRMHGSDPRPSRTLYIAMDRCIRDIILARLPRKSFAKLLGFWFSTSL